VIVESKMSTTALPRDGAFPSGNHARRRAPSIARVGHGAVLDNRRALYHPFENWLAVADLHFGYELSAKSAGALYPGWGMEEVERRLTSVVRDYKPKTLIIVGDLVENRAAALLALALLKRVRTTLSDAKAPFELVLIAGNHDRRCLEGDLLRDHYVTPNFCFYHGDRPEPNDAGSRTSIIGHFHPAATVRDKAGLHLKLPAFVQDGSLWTLPAFSPWASGKEWEYARAARVWLCGHGRILQLKR
jgi:putative SbcD/Mre11-related phosphoesterase